MSPRPNRFEDFFQDESYIALKNHLYNYVLRKRAVLGSIQTGNGITLEIGSGTSPIVAPAENVVYSDISFAAIRILKKAHDKGLYAVADSTQLPFRQNTFDNVVCSEVLEHIGDDRKAVGEIAGTLRSSGSLFITFPHRRIYFSCDDRFVRHLRRYELDDMEALLEGSGLTIVKVSKVLGLLEKIVMITTISLIRTMRSMRPAQNHDRGETSLSPVGLNIFKLLNRLLALLASLDAKITPLRYAAVVMIRAEKRRQGS